jgi:hypothetical protein
VIVVRLRLFVFVKAELDRELKVGIRLKTLSAVKHVYLIPGEFDLLAEFDYTSGITSLKEIGETIFKGVRELEHVTDTTTVIPTSSMSRGTFGDVADVYVLLRTKSGGSEARRRLSGVPEIKDVHSVFGEMYLFVQLQIISLSASSRHRISEMLGEKLVSIKWISNIETLELLISGNMIDGDGSIPQNPQLSVADQWKEESFNPLIGIKSCSIEK